jgi:hypothetical protein
MRPASNEEHCVATAHRLSKFCQQVGGGNSGLAEIIQIEALVFAMRVAGRVL